MTSQSISMVNRPNTEVEKLVEYRTAHYASTSEGAHYYTNTPAQVQFRFSNPILCQLVSGKKVMSVGTSQPFEFLPGDAMFVSAGQLIDIDLSAANAEQPIECLCVEIDNERLENILGRLNEKISMGGRGQSFSLDTQSFSVLRGAPAEALSIPSLMRLFAGERDIFSDLRIDAKIDDALVNLLQQQRQELLIATAEDQDTGIHAVARVIRHNLHRHISISDLAKVASMSETSLHRQFRKHFGTTPSRFANQVRIAEAKRTLRQSRLPVEQLAFELGFSDASHFSRVFRKTAGESPAEYRKRRQKPPNMIDW
jgi:AraC-like DNA-binding protein/uncharacterized cupin superfamily protein